MFKNYSLILIFIAKLILLNECLAFAEKPYTPHLGSPERKVILDTLREGFKYAHGPDCPEFQYGSIPEDVKLIFIVNYIKIKKPWAWVEVKGENYGVEIYALLVKEDKKWTLKGLIDPRLFLCSDSEECIDINHSIYKKFKEIFPSVPVDIFPEEHPECKLILKALRESIRTLPPESVGFIIRYLKVKNGWAWIETDPRGLDVFANYEPIDALLHKEKGKWKVKDIKPCCGDCEADPYCAKGIYHKKLIKLYPSVPKEIFPNKIRGVNWNY